MRATSWDFLSDPTVTEAAVRTKLLDFFALSNKLSPGRRGDTLFWALEIVYNLPSGINMFSPDLASTARRYGSTLTPIIFANAVVEKEA